MYTVITFFLQCLDGVRKTHYRFEIKSWQFILDELDTKNHRSEFYSKLVCDWKNLKIMIQHLLHSAKSGNEIGKMKHFGSFFGKLIKSVTSENLETYGLVRIGHFRKPRDLRH